MLPKKQQRQRPRTLTSFTCWGRSSPLRARRQSLLSRRSPRFKHLPKWASKQLSSRRGTAPVAAWVPAALVTSRGVWSPRRCTTAGKQHTTVGCVLNGAGRTRSANSRAGPSAAPSAGPSGVSAARLSPGSAMSVVLSGTLASSSLAHAARVWSVHASTACAAITMPVARGR